MFLDLATATVFDSTGFGRGSGIWSCDTKVRRQRWVSLPGGGPARVWKHGDGLMRVRDAGGISIRACAEPDVELSRLWTADGAWRFDGDGALWIEPLPLLVKGKRNHTDLIIVDGPAQRVTRHELNWFFEGDYDFGYQGPTECLAMPAVGAILVAVARSSTLVALDIHTGHKLDEIQLSGRGGAGNLKRLSDTTFAATNYDALCLVDATQGLIQTSDVLQLPKPPNTAQFIGNYDWGSVLAVARPFSRDVLKLDPKTFEVIGRGRVLHQPFDICMTSEKRFVTRSWKTGKVSFGAFRA
jgi:hypothetical protein